MANKLLALKINESNSPSTITPCFSLKRWGKIPLYWTNTDLFPSVILNLTNLPLLIIESSSTRPPSLNFWFILFELTSYEGLIKYTILLFNADIKKNTPRHRGIKKSINPNSLFFLGVINVLYNSLKQFSRNEILKISV